MKKPAKTAKKPHKKPALSVKQARGVGVSELARKLGCSRQLISVHAKRPDAPPMDDIPAWQAFLATIGREGSAPPELRKKLAEQRLRILKAMAIEKERTNHIKDREVIPFATVVQFLTELVFSFFFGELERLVQTLPALLKGRSELEISNLLKAEVEKIKAGLKNRLNSLGNGKEDQKT